MIFNMVGKTINNGGSNTLKYFNNTEINMRQSLATKYTYTCTFPKAGKYHISLYILAYTESSTNVTFLRYWGADIGNNKILTTNNATYIIAAPNYISGQPYVDTYIVDALTDNATITIEFDSPIAALATNYKAIVDMAISCWYDQPTDIVLTTSLTAV